MRKQRRQFMLTTSRLSILGFAGTFAACSSEDRPSGAQKTKSLLASLVDTITPADSFAGGIEIGLDTKLSTHMQAKRSSKQQLARLLDTIDQLSVRQFKRHFHLADNHQRELLLNNLLGNKNNVIARRDLSLIRNKLLYWYYQSPEGRASIHYQLPADYPGYQV